MNWEFIPEVFWDFIARILPGAFVLLAAYIVFCPSIESVSLGIVSLIILSIPSYFLSISLHQVWLFLFPNERKNERNTKCKIHRIMSDSQGTAILLLKLQAEIVSATVVMVGFCILAIAEFTIIVLDSATIQNWIILGILIFFWLTSRYWKKMLQEYQKNMLEEYKGP